MEKTRTIVVVDDDQTQARLLNDYLTEHGFKVQLAYTGLDGMQLIHEVNPDLIILDLYLPDTKGTEICAQLRANKGTQNIPIILCTAHKIGMTEKMEGFRAGVDDFLLRPFELSELLARITAILRRTQAAPTKDLLMGLGSLVNKPIAPPPSTHIPDRLPPALAPDEPLPTHRPINFLHRVWEVLNHPQRAFATLDENSDFIVSLFLIGGTTLLASFSKLTQKSTNFDSWIGILSLGMIVHSMLWIGTAGLLHLVLPFEGANVSMKKALSLAGLSWTPRFLSALFSFVYSLISLAGWSADATDFSSGLNLIPGVPATSWVNALSQVGIFDIWSALLTLVGMWNIRERTDRRWTSSTIVVFILSLLCGAFINT